MSNIISKPMSVKPDKDAKVSKAVVAEIDYSDCSREVERELASQSIVIRVAQTLRGAEKWKGLKNGDVIRVKAIDFAPKGAKVDVDEIMRSRIANAEGMDEHQKEAALDALGL